MSSRGVRLPGSFDSWDTARWAFFLSNDRLSKLQSDICVKQRRCITKADLQALWRKRLP